MEIELSVEPDSVHQGNRIDVRVTGDDQIGKWYVSVVSESGKIMSTPTVLSAHGQPIKCGDGKVAYEFWVSTVGYEYSGYRVMVAPSSEPLDKEMRIKRFVVTQPPPIIVSAGRRYPEAWGGRRQVLS